MLDVTRINKNTLAHHKEDINAGDGWQVFAASYGKAPRGGMGESVKRHVTRASLQYTHKYIHILPDVLRYTVCGHQCRNVVPLCTAQRHQR
jgi:hypothetical protein